MAAAKVDRRTIQSHRDEAYLIGWDDGYAEGFAAGFGKGGVEAHAENARLTAERDALTLDRQDLAAENQKLRRLAEEAVGERDEARADAARLTHILDGGGYADAERGCIECGAALPNPSEAVCVTCIRTARDARALAAAQASYTREE